MATDLVEIDPQDPQPEALERAAAAVRRGKVVAIPTDALYILVADPYNLRAVTGVFQAKGRESSRALPILIRDTMMAEELASELTARFFILARRFWPGPLTMIVPAAAKIPLKVTGNTGRLALAPFALRDGHQADRAAGPAVDLDERQYFGASDVSQRHRRVRHDGWPCGPRAGWRPLRGRGRDYDRYHRAVLARHQGRRDCGEGNRGVPGILVSAASKIGPAPMKYVLILLAGGVGSLARYFASSAIASRFGTRFPTGTMVVNVTGCFLIGLIMTLLTERQPHPYWRLVLVVGFLGGYTTFSSFEWETYAAVRGRRLLDRAGQCRGQRRVRLCGSLVRGAAGAALTPYSPTITD